MPGMRAIVERFRRDEGGIAIGLYVTAFSLGGAFSIWATSRLGHIASARTAIALTAVGPLLGGFLALALLSPAAPRARTGFREPFRRPLILIDSQLFALVLGFGWAAGAPRSILWPIMIADGIFITADSPAISRAIAELAEPERLGAAMALQTFVGYAAATVSPLAFGILLDLENPPSSVSSNRYPISRKAPFTALGALPVLGAVYVAATASRAASATLESTRTRPGRGTKTTTVPSSSLPGLDTWMTEE